MNEEQIKQLGGEIAALKDGAVVLSFPGMDAANLDRVRQMWMDGNSKPGLVYITNVRPPIVETVEGYYLDIVRQLCILLNCSADKVVDAVAQLASDSSPGVPHV